MFAYGPDILAVLEMSLSRERLTKYMRSSAGKIEQALDLYVHNTRISAELYAPLGVLEIALRNAIALRLRQAFREPWYDDPTFLALSPELGSRLDKVKKRLYKQGKPINEPQIIASLSFEFWVMLLRKGPMGRFEQILWRPHLRRAFSNIASLSRKEAHTVLHLLLELRNRIAHHEPIFQRNLTEDYNLILRAIAWIDPSMRNWVQHHHPDPADRT